jgi:hypothetical protein
MKNREVVKEEKKRILSAVSELCILSYSILNESDWMNFQIVRGAILYSLNSYFDGWMEGRADHYENCAKCVRRNIGESRMNE